VIPGRDGCLSKYLWAQLDYKLHRVTYDLVGWMTNTNNDGYTVEMYGTVQGIHVARGHYYLWGSAAVAGTNARPTNRDEAFGTYHMNSNLNPPNYLMGYIAPYYDHIELMNTCTYGVWVTVPYVVRFGRKAFIDTDLMTTFMEVTNTSSEQVQISDITSAYRTMMWRGAVCSNERMLENYGIKQFDFDRFRWGDILRVQKKKWRAYLKPGGVFRFRVRVPGCVRADANKFGAVNEMKHMDYGLVIVCKGDYGFAKDGASAPDRNDVVMLKQTLAMRRISSSRSVCSEYITGRTGFMADTQRLDGGFPAGTVTRPVPVDPVLESKTNVFN